MTLRAIYNSDAALVVTWALGSQWAARKVVALGPCPASVVLAACVALTTFGLVFLIVTSRAR